MKKTILNKDLENRIAYKDLFEKTASYGASKEFLKTSAQELTTVCLVIILPPTRILLKKFIPNTTLVILSNTASKILTCRLIFRICSLIYGCAVNKTIRQRVKEYTSLHNLIRKMSSCL